MEPRTPHQRLAEFLAGRGQAGLGAAGEVVAANPVASSRERWGSLQLSVEAADLLFQVNSLAQLDRVLEEQLYVQALELHEEGIVEVVDLRRLLGVLLFQRAAEDPAAPGLTPPEWALLLG